MASMTMSSALVGQRVAVKANAGRKVRNVQVRDPTTLLDRRSFDSLSRPRSGANSPRRVRCERHVGRHGCAK